jgi:hypothetical protein
MALDKFRASPLPNPPSEYDPQYIRQLIRVLENYFSQLDSNTANHAEKYTAAQFVGGDFTGTNITASSINTTFMNSYISTVGYEQANGINTQALIVGGAKAGRIVADDVSATNVYANDFWGDGQHIDTPYNQFQSDQTQTAPNVATANTLTLNIDDYPDGISIASGSRITVSHAGVYTIGFSIQAQNTATGTEQLDIWFRKNGTDIPDSNSRFGLSARKSATIPSSLIAVTNFMLTLAANDYVQIMWRVSDVAVTIPAFPAIAASAGVTPAIPATPSALVIVAFISAMHPIPTIVAPLPVFGFGQIGTISVFTP